MATKEQNIEMWAGETVRIYLTIDNIQSLSTEISDLWWKLKELRSAGDDLIYKRLGVGNQIIISGNSAVISLDKSDTENLSGVYHHEARAVGANGREATVAVGRCTINESMFV